MNVDGRGVAVIIVERGLFAFYIALSPIKKGMNSTIQLPAMGK